MEEGTVVVEMEIGREGEEDQGGYLPKGMGRVKEGAGIG